MSVVQAMLIAVTGPTASGKSTLSKLLSEYYQFSLIEEQWADNPYLLAFNEGKGSFLEAERWFIESDASRYQEAVQLVQNGEGVILDKPYFENHTYVATAPLSTDEATSCHDLLSRITQEFTAPQLIIDITASPDLSLSRIQSRGRPEEFALSAEWFTKWAQEHNNSQLYWPSAPILRVSADLHDFLSQQEFKKLVKKIEGMLRH